MELRQERSEERQEHTSSGGGGPRMSKDGKTELLRSLEDFSHVRYGIHL